MWISRDQNQIDSKNAQFWNELCGSVLARSIDIREVSPENLRRFDYAYMALYPYLWHYVVKEGLEGKKILEIGLGYGTLFGQVLASSDCEYYGLDIAEGPVAMMRYRLTQLGRDGQERVQVGSALDTPYEDLSFDYVYSIGCLHHTGNLRKAVSEVYRVFKTGGKAIVMLCNRHSFRQWVHIPLIRLCGVFLKSRQYSDSAERVRALYDTNAQGDTAHHTQIIFHKQKRNTYSATSRRSRLTFVISIIIPFSEAGLG